MVNYFLRSKLFTEKEICSPNRDLLPENLTASWARTFWQRMPRADFLNLPGKLQEACGKTQPQERPELRRDVM